VSKRQIITDYTASPGLFGSASMHLIEMTVKIFHYHLFCSYLKEGGAEGLFRKIGLNIVCQETPVLGLVRMP
jgi:hypothetical protein